MYFFHCTTSDRERGFFIVHLCFEVTAKNRSQLNEPFFSVVSSVIPLDQSKIFYFRDLEALCGVTCSTSVTGTEGGVFESPYGVFFCLSI